jgi:hypothetical protein
MILMKRRRTSNSRVAHNAELGARPAGTTSPADACLRTTILTTAMRPDVIEAVRGSFEHGVSERAACRRLSSPRGRADALGASRRAGAPVVASLPPSLDMESYRLELREPESFDELPDVTMRNPRSDQN